MIPIAMKSKGATDQNSILSINQARTQSALCAQTITTLNKPPAARRAAQALPVSLTDQKVME